MLTHPCWVRYSRLCLNLLTTAGMSPLSTTVPAIQWAKLVTLWSLQYYEITCFLRVDLWHLFLSWVSLHAVSDQISSLSHTLLLYTNKDQSLLAHQAVTARWQLWHSAQNWYTTTTPRLTWSRSSSPPTISAPAAWAVMLNWSSWVSDNW